MKMLFLLTDKGPAVYLAICNIGGSKLGFWSLEVFPKIAPSDPREETVSSLWDADSAQNELLGGSASPFHLCSPRILASFVGTCGQLYGTPWRGLGSGCHQSCGSVGFEKAPDSR